jgi:transposase-like protein
MKPKKKRRMRCIYCGCIRTVRNGKRIIVPVSFDRRTKREVQRYRCKKCGISFSKRKWKKKKYSFGFKVEITRMHVEERLSYRVMSKRIKERFGKNVSSKELCKMVNEVAERTKGSVAIKEEYRPKWEGYLTVDDKYINVKGEKFLSLIAVDSSGDTIHSELITEVTQDKYDDFFRFIVERLDYPVKAVTTDLDGMLEKSIKTVILSDIPHQRCIWHGLERVKELINYQQTRKQYKQLKRRYDELLESLEDKKSSYYRSQLKIEQMRKELEVIEAEYLEKDGIINEIKDMLYRQERKGTLKKFSETRKQYGVRYPEVISFLSNNLDGLIMHQRDERMPKTTIMAENVNKQLERRFKTIEAFQTIDTAFNYLNLIRNYLRFKPYTDCRGSRKYRNGRCPLELCSVKLMTRDWLKNSLNWT